MISMHSPWWNFPRQEMRSNDISELTGGCHADLATCLISRVVKYSPKGGNLKSAVEQMHSLLRGSNTCRPSWGSSSAPFFRLLSHLLLLSRRSALSLLVLLQTRAPAINTPLKFHRAYHLKNIRRCKDRDRSSLKMYDSILFLVFRTLYPSCFIMYYILHHHFFLRRVQWSSYILLFVIYYIHSLFIKM